MKTILVPLDGSEFAEQALEEGLEDGSRDDEEIVLMHCLDFNQLFSGAARLPPYSVAEIEEQNRARTQLYLDQQVDKLVARGYAARSVIVTGPAVDGILRVGRELAASKILLTTHGRGGLDRLFMGSVAEGVVRKADRPVLLMPPSSRTTD